MTLYRNLDKAKVQFDFVVNENNECFDFEEEILSMGGYIYRIPRFNMINIYSYLKKWNNLLTDHKEYKIIHAHHTSPAFIYLLLAKSKGIKTISHSHTAGGNSIKSTLKNISRYPLRLISDYLFACSKDAAYWMYGEKHSKNATIINNSIDIKLFLYNKESRSYMRNNLNIEDRFVIGHVGRFDNSKNHNFLIDIFQEIKKRKSNATLLLVGDGQLKNQIKEKVNKLDLSDSVIYTGVRSDVPDLLQSMDVFVFPSLYEGLPLVLIEAQAAGLKCFTSADVVSDEARVTDLLEFIPLDKSPEEWAVKILEYADGYERINMGRKIIKAGYDVNENVRWIENFYLSVAK
jgi:glycosyltransferase involved in cell wall biosynthesis